MRQMPEAGNRAKAETEVLAEYAADDCDYWNLGDFLV